MRYSMYSLMALSMLQIQAIQLFGPDTEAEKEKARAKIEIAQKYLENVNVDTKTFETALQDIGEMPEEQKKEFLQKIEASLTAEHRNSFIKSAGCGAVDLLAIVGFAVGFGYVEKTDNIVFGAAATSGGILAGLVTDNVWNNHKEMTQKLNILKEFLEKEEAKKAAQ